MTKFYGNIGFVVTKETSPGIWEEQEEVRPYYGLVNRNQRRWQGNEDLNDDILVSNEISVIADDFILENLGAMKWVEWMNSKWKINSIELEYPRIKLTIGGIWNG